MPGIFVNYRRGDHVDLLDKAVDQLGRHFGEGHVFMDVRSIDAGHHYPDVLRKRLIDAEVVLAVIHDGWFTERDEQGRRKIDRAEDWVRQELLLAQQYGKPVVPVLLADAQLPQPTSMEPWLRRVLSTQAARVHPRTRTADVTRLIETLEKDIAPLWNPADARSIEPIRLSRRWLYAILPPVLIAFLAGPAVLVRDDLPAAGGEVPPLLEPAVMFTMMSIVVAVALGIFWPVTRKALHSLDSEFQRAPARDYYTATQSLMAVLILLVGGFTFYAGTSAAGWMIVLAGSLFAAAYGGLLGIRSRRQDEELDANWPHWIPEPMHPSQVRRALVRTGRRLTRDWSQPLSRIQRDQGRWMLDTLTEATAALRRQAAMSRKDWLLRRHPWAAGAYLAWNTLIVGLVLASAVTQVRTGTNPISSWAVFLAGTIVVLGAVSALTIEICYRSHRRRIGRIADEVGNEVRRLDETWHELCKPLSWQLVQVPPRASAG